MARHNIHKHSLRRLAFCGQELVYSLGVGERKIRQLIDEGELCCTREGTAVLITIDRVTTYLKQKQAAAGWFTPRISEVIEKPPAGRNFCCDNCQVAYLLGTLPAAGAAME